MADVALSGEEKRATRRRSLARQRLWRQPRFSPARASLGGGVVGDGGAVPSKEQEWHRERTHEEEEQQQSAHDTEVRRHPAHVCAVDSDGKCKVKVGGGRVTTGAGR